MLVRLRLFHVLRMAGIRLLNVSAAVFRRISKEDPLLLFHPALTYLRPFSNKDTPGRHASPVHAELPGPHLPSPKGSRTSQAPQKTVFL